MITEDDQRIGRDLIYMYTHLCSNHWQAWRFPDSLKSWPRHQDLLSSARYHEHTLIVHLRNSRPSFWLSRFVQSIRVIHQSSSCESIGTMKATAISQPHSPHTNGSAHTHGSPNDTEHLLDVADKHITKALGRLRNHVFKSGKGLRVMTTVSSLDEIGSPLPLPLFA